MEGVREGNIGGTGTETGGGREGKWNRNEESPIWDGHKGGPGEGHGQERRGGETRT